MCLIRRNRQEGVGVYLIVFHYTYIRKKKQHKTQGVGAYLIVFHYTYIRKKTAQKY